MATLLDCINKLNEMKVSKNSDATFNSITVNNDMKLLGNALIEKNIRVTGFYLAVPRRTDVWYPASLGIHGYRLTEQSIGSYPSLNGVTFQVCNSGENAINQWRGDFYIGDNDQTCIPTIGGIQDGVDQGLKKLATQ